MNRNTNKVIETVGLDRIPTIANKLLKDEALGGKLILLAAVLALVVANSPLSTYYQEFWNHVLSIGVGDYAISMSLSHWVSEGLMAIFFLVVGLEIKREIVRGRLRDPRAAVLPIGAAIGGMIVPAVLFFMINQGQPETLRGWAIPIATDIAFAVAVMSLLGNRVSSALKLFLLTLAIVDDIGAVLIIALFYNSGLSPAFLFSSLLLCGLILVLNRLKLMSVALFVLLSVVLWVFVYESGVHASITGALLGLLAPLAAYKGSSIAERLESASIPVSTFIVVPLFAFASLGIVVAIDTLSLGSTLAWGIVIGLVFGKVIGVTLTSWVLVRLKLAVLPDKSNWFQLAGVGLLAGIGFTISVFIAELAFSDNASLMNTAKISILIASTVSAIAGYLFLRHRQKVEEILTK